MERRIRTHRKEMKTDKQKVFTLLEKEKGKEIEI